MCNTSNLGQPAGKLQGFRGSSVVAPGSDNGSLSLTLPAQTVNRGDHGNSRAQFSCAVDWIQDTTSDVHTVHVACESLVLHSLTDLLTTVSMEQFKVKITQTQSLIERTKSNY